ncbi:MAG: hypothetical protein MOB07_29175 [Acidobacteria bacterium]|nr:hypothetical protein [Acidobacteriota bacterium]
MLIATYFIIRRVPSLYETRTLIVVANLNFYEGQSQGGAYGTVLQQLTSRGNMAGLVNRYKLYPQVKDHEGAIGALQKAVKLDVKMKGYQPDGPESITISFRYPDPNIAQKVMSDLVAIFEQANQGIRKQAVTEVNEMNTKIAEVEDRLKRIAPQSDMELIRAQQVSRAAGDATAIRTQKFTIETSIDTLSDKEFQLKRSISDMQQQIAEQENIVKAEAAGPQPIPPAVGSLLVRKAELEAQIKLFLTQYTEKNPKIIQARELLSEVNRQIARLESSATGGEGGAARSPAATELKRMKLELKRMETDLDVTRRDLTRKTQTLANMSSGSGGGSMPADPALSGLNDENRSEYDRLLARYNGMLTRQETLMKFAGIAGSETPMFQIIDFPNRPELPVTPNRQLLYLFALSLAMVFGLLIVIAFELPRVFLLNDERDVQYYLGAPVVALIPETFTPVERTRARRLRLTRSLIFLMLAVGIVPVLILLLSRLGVFQFLGSK